MYLINKIISSYLQFARLSLVVVVLILCVFASPVSSRSNQSDPSLVIYGAEALPIEGDDDHTMVIYFKVPRSETKRLFLRIFDADTSGGFDLGYGLFDTKTRFRLFGGVGAFSSSSSTAQAKLPSPDDLKSGVLIRSETIGVSTVADSTWRTFAMFDPSEGEVIADGRVFKLVVQGITGNDANVFDIALSTEKDQNTVPENLAIFTYSPTFRVFDRRGLMHALRFSTPVGTDQIITHDFDAARAISRLETRYRSIVLPSSGQGTEQKNIINIDKNYETGEALILFSGGREMPNDITISLTDGRGTNLPIELPIRLQRPNKRPIPRADLEVLGDCLSVSFDGSRSSDDDGDVISFGWDFGDGKRGTGKSVVHQYQRTGAYEPILYITDESNQIDRGAKESFSIFLNQPPVAKIVASTVLSAPGKLVSFDASNSHDADHKLKSFLWDFNDGSTAKGVKVSHAFRKPGAYHVRLSVEDNSGLPCSIRSEYVEVKINWPPIAEIGQSRVVSIGEKITLDGSRSYDVDGEIKVYNWDLGDGAKIQGQSIEHSYKAARKYDVMLTVEDNSGVENSTDTSQRIIIVNAPPIPKAGDDTISAVGQVIDFDGTDSVDPDGKIIEYSWDFGNGTVAKGVQVSYAYPKPGNYQVTLTARDDSGSSSPTAQDTLRVQVNTPPIAKAGSDQLVTSSEVRFDGTASVDPDGKIARYLWDFGDGQTSTDPAPVHVYKSTGPYKVRLTVEDNSGLPRNTAFDEVNVLVNAMPIADAGSEQVVAPEQSVFFSALESFDPDGKITQYSWDFGDGQSAKGEKVEHKFSRTGKYTVQLGVQDNTGNSQAIDFDHTEIFVNAPPIANVLAVPVSAPGDTLIFDGRGSLDPDGDIQKFQWEFSDDKKKVEGNKVSKKFLKPGIYTARLTVIDNSGAINSTSQDQVSVRINHSPKAVPGKNIFTDQITIEVDGSASIDSDGDPLTYFWDFGDKSPLQSGIKATHQYTKGGIYPVVLKVDDGTGLANSTNTTALTVTINRPPTAEAGPNHSVCAGDIVAFDGGKSFDPDGDLLKYRWNFGDGTDASGVNPTKIYKNPGSYPVSLMVKDDSGMTANKDSAQVVVQVDESPIADAGPDQQVCTNRDVEFDGTKSTDLDGVVNRYSWSFGDGHTGAGMQPVHTYTKPGNYRTRLTIEGDSSGSCDNLSNDEMMVEVIEAPIATFIGPENAALNAPVTFDASKSSTPKGKIKAWEWSFGDGSKGQGEKIVHQYKQPGKYIVTLTIKVGKKGEACNTNFTKRAIFINAPPVAIAGEDQIEVIGQDVVLNASKSTDADGAISKYQWDFGDGEKADDIVVRHRYLKSGSYEVTLTVTDTTKLANNSTSDSLKVRINATPAPEIVGSTSTCSGEQTNFDASRSKDQDGDKLSYSWNFGDGQDGKGNSIKHAFNKPGHYTVTLTADDERSLPNSLNHTSIGVLVNQPPVPVARFPGRVLPGTKAVFDGFYSADLDGSLIDYQWDFGEGLTIKGKKVTHKFEKAGRYPFRLRVTDNSGTACASTEQSYNIIVNSKPTAVAGADREAYTGGVHDAVTFDATQSSDADGDSLNYLWHFGDGDSEVGSIVKHTYTRPGTYKVKLQVDDGHGLAHGGVTDELIIKVRERP